MRACLGLGSFGRYQKSFGRSLLLYWPDEKAERTEALLAYPWLRQPCPDIRLECSDRTDDRRKHERTASGTRGKDLLPNELIGAYARRGTKIHNMLLEIQKENQPERRRTLYTCGETPYYTADVEICEKGRAFTWFQL